MILTLFGAMIILAPALSVTLLLICEYRRCTEMNGKWDECWRCPCGRIWRTYGYSSLWVQHDSYVCSSCGEHEKTFETITLMWTSLACWWKPWTWKIGRWVDRDMKVSVEKRTMTRI